MTKAAMFECTETACGLRFPAAVADPRLERCPACTGRLLRSMPLATTVRQERSASWSTGQSLALLLDNLRSAYNVGSIFRTADGAGVSHIYLCGISPTPAQSRVAKTALGAEQQIPWSWHPNGLALAAELVADGTQLWALDNLPGAHPLYDLDPPVHPVTLVVGNEQFGVDPGLLAHSHRVVSLPMLGAKRSLNVASAAAIAIYHLRMAQSP